MHTFRTSDIEGSMTADEGSKIAIDRSEPANL